MAGAQKNIVEGLGMPCYHLKQGVNVPEVKELV